MVGIKMNYINFTTDKPTVEQSSDSDTYGSGRDIAYLVFSILQFLTTVIGLVWVNYVIRKQERKRSAKEQKDERERLEKEQKDERERLEKEQKDERERLAKDKKDERERYEKEERDKIADIINNEYNKIVEKGIDENLRKCKTKFEHTVMFYGSVWETGDRRHKITGLDVLRFMLLNPNDFKSEPLTKLQQDLDAVVRLFQSLRIKLPLKGDCPINIKEELGLLITDVGETAKSFVSARKRYTISKVLKYFNNDQKEVMSIEDEKTKDSNDETEIKRILPYVDALLLGPIVESLLPSSTPYHDDVFSFDKFRLGNVVIVAGQNDIIHRLENITYKLCKKKLPVRAEDLGEITDTIDSIWKEKIDTVLMPDWGKEVVHLCANIIHALRVFMLKVVEGSDIIHDEEFKKLVDSLEGYVGQRIDFMDKIYFIEGYMRMLENRAHLCAQQSIVEMVTRVRSDITSTNNTLND